MSIDHQVMDRALFHMDNAYNIPNIKGTGKVCKTNLSSNTAFRGFGGPQGMMVAECWMSDIAFKCGLPAEEVCTYRDVGTKDARLKWSRPSADVKVI